jgi:hypothetical protein
LRLKAKKYRLCQNILILSRDPVHLTVREHYLARRIFLVTGY